MTILRGSPINWTTKGCLFIGFSQSGEIGGERWAEYIATLQDSTYTHVCGTAFGPINISSLQRKEATNALKGKKVVAIIDHIVARGIITAMGWLGMEIKGFDWDRVDDAIKFLGPPDLDNQEIVQIVLELRKASEV